MPHRSESAQQHAGQVPEAAIRAQLEQILASEVFSRSERLSRFLRFVVEQTLDGQSGALKEQILACELYGKRTDFDAARDAVVRVDARRLRDKLREYYAGAPNQPVIVELPRGAYVPSFEWNVSALLAPVPAVSEGEPQESATHPSRHGKPQWIALTAIVGIISVGVTIRLWTSIKPSDSPKLTPLTAYPGDENWPSLSPDGNFVAFTCDSPEVPTSPDICVKEVGTEALQRLVATPAAENFPAWSPDGREIAFHRGRGAKEHGIFIVSRVGGPERKVADTGTLIAWTPDGKSLLIRDRSEAGPFGIRQINLESFEQRWVTKPESGAGEWSFAVSPGGDTLAFIRYQRPGISDVYVVPMNGGEPRRLTDWKVNLSGPAWTQDGKELIYEADDRLWRISPLIAKPGRGTQFSNVPMPIQHFSISRPGADRPVRLAFHTPVEQISLRLIDLDSAAADGIFQSIAPFAPATRRDAPGRFSPDGSKVAFTSTRGSPDYELWVADRDGRNARQLTFFGSNRVMLAQTWSPDGKSILFETAVDGNNDIYVISSQGGTPRRLTSSPAIDGLPDWSTDGQWIYYLSIASGTAANIWRMPAHGGPAEQITKDGGSEPQLSPDGRYIYYLDQSPMRPSFGARLMRIPAAGGEPTVIHQGLSPLYWCVTQRGIYFLQPEGNVHAVHLLRFSDQKAVRVGKLPFQVTYVYGPGRLTVSRDGRWALVNVVDRREGDLVLLENFR